MIPQVSELINISIPRTQYIVQGSTSATSAIAVSHLWWPVPRKNGLTSKLPGFSVIPGRFTPIVKKNSVIGEVLSQTHGLQRVYKTLEDALDQLPKNSTQIYAYDGEGDTDWAEDESGNLLPQMRRVCTLKADLSGLQKFLKVEKGSHGQNFWKVMYSVNVYFGDTALKARMTWYEGVSNLYFHPQGAELWLCL